jgi:NADP-dependent 3-hydroxy acid dehydrogenase YdfG
VTVEELAGRVAVVTGAASGIGRGIAGALAAQGMRIVAADLDSARLAVMGAELRRDGAEVIELLTDVRDAAAVQALAAAALEAYGAVHVICNNAGVWTVGYQWETDLADWSWVIDVNLWGVIHGVRTFVPILLRNAEGGHVVNTASLGGIVAGPLTGPYAATKHAVVGMSKSLRADLAMNGAKVGVSVVCPGKVRTSLLDHVNQRPESATTPKLSPQAQAVVDAMRGTDADAMSAEQAGLLIRDAIIQNRFWVLPGADAHLPFVQRDTQELLEAFED